MKKKMWQNSKRTDSPTSNCEIILCLGSVWFSASSLKYCEASSLYPEPIAYSPQNRLDCCHMGCVSASHFTRVGTSHEALGNISLPWLSRELSLTCSQHWRGIMAVNAEGLWKLRIIEKNICVLYNRSYESANINFCLEQLDTSFVQYKQAKFTQE